jgi:hypothetical protein
VRISGQDVERGTFSQRYAVLVDQKSVETPSQPLPLLFPPLVLSVVVVGAMVWCDMSSRVVTRHYLQLACQAVSM